MSDQVDTLREQARQILKDNSFTLDVSFVEKAAALNQALDTLMVAIDLYCQGVAKEAYRTGNIEGRMSENVLCRSDLARGKLTDERLCKRWDEWKSKLTGNKPGQTERISKAKGGSK